MFQEEKATAAALLIQTSAIKRLLHEVRAWALRNMLFIVVTFPTLQPLKSAFILTAPTKVLSRDVTEVVIHEFKPVPAKLNADWNVPCSDFTFATFHLLRSEFIAFAMKKVWSRDVTEVVIHLLMSVPTNALALLLPFTTCEPPASSRYWENAQLKSVTPLTSKSPMSPHLAVAAPAFWT